MAKTLKEPKLLPRLRLWLVVAVVVVALLAVYGLSWYWSYQPNTIHVTDTRYKAGPTGVLTATALIDTMQTLLDKPGGYLSNDIMPPGVLMDNMPSFEFGAVVQIRDLTRAMRNEFSRSQSQSVNDPDLSEAEPKFNVSADSWAFPSSESAYRAGIKFLKNYRARLLGKKQPQANFYARPAGLVDWLQVASKRLGALSQRLAANAGQRVVLKTPAGGNLGKNAHANGNSGNASVQPGPWLQIDDTFYEARGASWALLNFALAMRQDFKQVIKNKDATPTFNSLISALRASQQPIGSPIIFNGSPFGIFPNHSLTMAAYLASANVIVINLQKLLNQN